MNHIQDFASLLQAFFTDRLMRQRRASPHTIGAYRDTFRILFAFVQRRLKKQPSSLTLTDLDADLVIEFLNYLEHDRGNTVRTRNARLAAIHSFYRYASFERPDLADLIRRVLAVPTKRFERRLVPFLIPPEVEALLAAPDQETWLGRRDHAIISTFAQTGLRVSELTALSSGDIQTSTGAHIRCHGKGRKDRAVPLTRKVAAMLKSWVRERTGEPTGYLFPSARGGRLSSDAIQRAFRRYAELASRHCPSLEGKCVSPHVLRHSYAVHLRRTHRLDLATIAMLMGHESVDTTRIYSDVDLVAKEQILQDIAPINGRGRIGRYRPDDKLLEFLKSL